MFDWDKVIDNFSKFYYTPLLMLIVEVTALVMAIIYIRKTKIGKAFIFYIAFDLCMLIVDCFLISHSGISKKFRFYFQDTTNTLIAYVELLVYFYFFRKILEGNKIKKILTGLVVIYSAIIIIFLTTKFGFVTNRYSYLAYITGVIEFIFLLVPCVYYFLHLFKANSLLRLTDRPSFWIVTGIFFFSLISIPCYLLNKYLSNNYKQLWPALQAALYIIPFTLNFAFLIKAFLCKKPLTI
jgi:hypothetical protein